MFPRECENSANSCSGFRLIELIFRAHNFVNKQKLKIVTLLEVHGVPPGRKGEGVTRLIYENLNGLQSTLLSKNEKLEKARRVIVSASHCPTRHGYDRREEWLVS